ncbi:MAG: hypothetical protein LBI74_10730 [Synergistaceae bacterium]|jgi:hypothetical protein|nr:hypothetical protein [Synergistaceae bacterium]
MMAPNSTSSKRSEMLSMSSTPKEMLRALYLHGTDHLILCLNRRELFFYKDQIIELMGHGDADKTIDELISRSADERAATNAQIEEAPQDTPLLVFSLGKKDTGDLRFELVKTTFGEYRERRVRENTIVLPEWWSIPLPILHMTEDAIFLNDRALGLIPGGAMSLASQIDRIREDRIITLNGDGGEEDRTFSLYALTDGSYLIEDVSGDFEIAEDLVWWAAAGRALVRRMEDRGVWIKRLSAYESPPENASEVIQCSWDGEIMGHLAIGLPSGESPGAARERDDSHPRSGSRGWREAAGPHEELTGRSAEPPLEDVHELHNLIEPDAGVSDEDKPYILAQIKRNAKTRAKDESVGRGQDKHVAASKAKDASSAATRGGTADSIRKNEARTAYSGKKRKFKERASDAEKLDAPKRDAGERDEYNREGIPKGGFARIDALSKLVTAKLDAREKDDEHKREGAQISGFARIDAVSGLARDVESPVITPVKMRRPEDDSYSDEKYDDDRQ